MPRPRSLSALAFSGPLGACRLAALVVVSVGLAACAGEPGSDIGGEGADVTASGAEAAPESGGGGEPAGRDPASNRVVELLASGQPVFGIFSGDQTREQGTRIVETEGADFILYSLERGPFDMGALEAYIDGMVEAAGEEIVGDMPVLLRTPPIHTDPPDVRAKVEEALETGIGGIVFPHVTSAAEAALSVELTDGPWPADPDGRRVDVLIVEDREGVSNVRDIVATPGLSVVFAGPGDLRRAYEGDMEAVETAIQTVLAACLEFDVACGVTAGADDIAERLEQGFRVIIVTEEEALAVGREAAGRS